MKKSLPYPYPYPTVIRANKCSGGLSGGYARAFWRATWTGLNSPVPYPILLSSSAVIIFEEKQKRLLTSPPLNTIIELTVNNKLKELLI